MTMKLDGLKIMTGVNAVGDKYAVLMLDDGTRIANVMLNDDGTIKSATTSAFMRTLLSLTEKAV